MTMDFDPPRVERPARGLLLALVGLPLGALGFWLASWSTVLDVLVIAFIAFAQVLLYRRGARSRVIRRGRVPLLVVGTATTVLSIVIGAAVSDAYLAGAPAPVYLRPGQSLGVQPATLLFSLVGGVASLVYFVRRFSVDRPPT